MGLPPPPRKSKMFVFLNKRPSPNMDLKTTNIMQVTFVKKLKMGTISTEID